jgi:hypothetical protein
MRKKIMFLAKLRYRIRNTDIDNFSGQAKAFCAGLYTLSIIYLLATTSSLLSNEKNILKELNCAQVARG